MSEQLKRYDMSLDCDGESGRCRNNIVISADGDYVLYADHIAAMNRAPAAAPADLHDAIMNLPCDKVPPYPFSSGPCATQELRAYKEGHKDARHAAAELVASAPAAAPDSREAFENSYRRNFPNASADPSTFERDADGDYVGDGSYVGWTMWEAAMASKPSAAQIRDAALEEAAQICTIPGSVNWVWQEAMEKCASNIRALKSKGEQP